MSELCVYAIAARRGERISVRGVAGERLQTVPVGRLDVIVGRVKVLPEPTDRNLRRYDRAVSALWNRSAALLPVRFGTSARDIADLEAIVRSRERDLRLRLEATRNRAQMTVRLVQGPGIGDRGLGIGDRGSGTGDRGLGRRQSRPSGASFLRARADEARRARDVPAFAPLRAAVKRFVRDERVEKRGGVASIYHLIPRASAGRYRSAIEEAAHLADVRMIVSGPWPPYAFADSA